MTTTTPDSSRQTSTPLHWTGRILSGLAILFLLLDAGAKLVPVQPALEGTIHLGFKNQTPEFVRMLGGLLMGCTLLYAIPRTAALGAILLTGFLGGTIAIHLRLGHPLFSHVLFGGYIGVLVWVGLGLRNRHVWRLFLPSRDEPTASHLNN